MVEDQDLRDHRRQLMRSSRRGARVRRDQEVMEGFRKLWIEEL
jgi:hypothetical protein